MSAVAVATEPRNRRTELIGPAWTALWLAETRRMMRHPAVLIALVIILAAWLVPLVANGVSGQFPDLTSRSWTVQYLLLLLAASTFIAANLATLRPHRFGTREFEQVLSLPAGPRAAAIVAAAAGPALTGLLVAGAQLGVASLMPGAAGTIRWGEMLAVPMTILLAGSLGVAAGALTRNMAAGFLALAVLAVVGFFGLIADGTRGRWLSFAAGENPFTQPPLPSALIDRPQWWHLAWLAGLTMTAAVVALGAAGARRRMLIVPLVLSLVVSVAAAAGQLRPMSAEQRGELQSAHDAPSAMQVCDRRGDDTYCAFPEFRSRIDAWADIVEAQRALVPPAAAPPAFPVRQHLSIPVDALGTAQPLPADRWAADDARAGTADAVPVSTRWASGGADSFDETEVIGYSALIADRMTGARRTPADGPTVCGARGALIVWLAAGATAETRAAFGTVQSHTSGGGGMSFSVLGSQAGVRVGPREMALGEALLAGEPGAVRERVAARWANLIDGATTVDQGAALLGLRATPEVPELAKGLCG